jgi:hypothetical protein
MGIYRRFHWTESPSLPAPTVSLRTVRHGVRDWRRGLERDSTLMGRATILLVYRFAMFGMVGKL